MTDRPSREIYLKPLSGTKRRPRPLGDGDEHVDRLLAELAGRQHGVVGVHQLVVARVGRRLISSRLERGALHQIHRGVYAVGHPVVSSLGRWMAATLALGPEAVLSHRSAGELWGIAPRSSRAIDVTRPTVARPRRGIVPHRGRLRDDERTAVEGIPVTTVPRTVLDCAAMASRRDLERMLNEIEVRGLTDPLSVPDLLARYPGRHGTTTIRELLDEGAEVGGVTKNDFEEMLVAALDAHALPRPRFNADLHLRGRFFSADALWPGPRLIVELDSRSVHGTRRAFEADRERDRLLIADGWRIIRVTWRQLSGEPDAIAADLRTALRLGA